MVSLSTTALSVILGAIGGLLALYVRERQKTRALQRELSYELGVLAIKELEKRADDQRAKFEAAYQEYTNKHGPSGGAGDTDGGTPGKSGSA